MGSDAAGTALGGLGSHGGPHAFGKEHVEPVSDGDGEPAPSLAGASCASLWRWRRYDVGPQVACGRKRQPNSQPNLLNKDLVLLYERP